MAAIFAAFPVGCTTNANFIVEDVVTAPAGTTTGVASTVGGSTLDTVLYVETISGTPAGCNDDFGGLQSKVTFSVTPGTTYRILKGTFGTSSTGPMTVTTTFT